jgi:hypothetical protein
MFSMYTVREMMWYKIDSSLCLLGIYLRWNVQKKFSNVSIIENEPGKKNDLREKNSY